MRVDFTGDSGLAEGNPQPYATQGQWPYYWVSMDNITAPQMMEFRRVFSVNKDCVVRVFVSADERYKLCLDGNMLGCGPERGNESEWYFETYDLQLTAGTHELCAVVWVLGRFAPWAQVSIRNGFLCAPADIKYADLLGTGIAGWQVRAVSGFGAHSNRTGGGGDTTLDYNCESTELQTAKSIYKAIEKKFACMFGDRRHLLAAGKLPAMMMQEQHTGMVRAVQDKKHNNTVDIYRSKTDEAASWQKMIGGEGEVIIPPHTTRWVVIDLDEYYSAYPSISTIGGAGTKVIVTWAEALYDKDYKKGIRGEIDGKRMDGTCDKWVLNGEKMTHVPVWWRAGRYISIEVITTDEPAVITDFHIIETRYPLEMEGIAESSNPAQQQLNKINFRTLQMCAHEHYMDCPHFEQLMYIGDTRVEVLTTYVTSSDDRLPRKAVKAFADSRLASGWTQENYPVSGIRLIPPFSLWWVGMVYDYSLWQDDKQFIIDMMPAVRSVMETAIACINRDGLFVSPLGWNYTDAIPGKWVDGVAPGGQNGEISGVLNLHLVLALKYLRKLEEFAGETELANRAERISVQLTEKINQHFWDNSRGIYADNLEGDIFSEHAQIYAVLADILPTEKLKIVAWSLRNDADLHRASLYFSHYLFEVYRLLGMTDLYEARLEKDWGKIIAMDMRTAPEHDPDTTRSECHAWSANPVYHFYATTLGIRPMANGFNKVLIQPNLGSLTWAKGTMQHKHGEIMVDLKQTDNHITGIIILPAGLEGEYRQNGTVQVLAVGENVVE
ncbi:MAG: alpha-L-rhamnosidase C-terminal domain-containing protein [bacterium]